MAQKLIEAKSQPVTSAFLNSNTVQSQIAISITPLDLEQTLLLAVGKIK